ncbi:tripartite tricarboxylate transporter substrate binding protein [Roseomonas sp. CAU 1739]|uniref:Bug family tripartite tricarboxylate transporter substrate binding protein n=1 Tax=Roseomonas sp. CAU 1739 TaxID=3140364 RepID=UPI00325BFE46
MNRRHLLTITAAALAAPRLCFAQDAWPSRPVTLLVPFAAGGSNDVVARFMAPVLEQKFGQSFIIDNRPGGGGSLGMGMVVRARPDAQTLLVSSASNHVFHPLVSGDVGYDVREVLVGVSMLTDVPTVLAANPGIGVNTVPELIAKIRATRGGFAFGSSGAGTSNHLAGELFRMRMDLDMTHVPYRGGGPALTDLVAGTIPIAFMNLPTVAPAAEDGRLKIIGVCTGERVSVRPNLPTVMEQGVPDFAVRSWTGLFAPRGTPQAIVDRLGTAVREALAAPPLVARLTALAAEPIVMTPAQTDAFVRQEYERWGPVVRSANISANG